MLFWLLKEDKMKKYFTLFLIMILPVLLFSPGCKALAVNGGNGEEEIDVPGTWVFTNVLKTDETDVHQRTFVLTGDKNTGSVSEALTNMSGPYTVTGKQIVLDLEASDVVYRWTYLYEGTIADNHHMSGTMKTTTYPAGGGDPIGEYEYNFTAQRKK